MATQRKRWLVAFSALASAAIAVAVCCETTHVHYNPTNCAGRQYSYWVPGTYNTCDFSFYSTVGCNAFTQTKDRYVADYSGCPGSGCSGCTPDVSHVEGPIAYTDYSDRPC
ncbi:MAG: hypothetical protein UZ18_ATM001000975 [Armatimonadetes bacterium OLB18]|nr:MAG: hypothetical protein UZ18_ATM001000975 [Armatimonadetes bacterium OLB18]